MDDKLRELNDIWNSEAISKDELTYKLEKFDEINNDILRTINVNMTNLLNNLLEFCNTQENEIIILNKFGFNIPSVECNKCVSDIRKGVESDIKSLIKDVDVYYNEIYKKLWSSWTQRQKAPMRNIQSSYKLKKFYEKSISTKKYISQFIDIIEEKSYLSDDESSKYGKNIKTQILFPSNYTNIMIDWIDIFVQYYNSLLNNTRPNHFKPNISREASMFFELCDYDSSQLTEAYNNFYIQTTKLLSDLVNIYHKNPSLHVLNGNELASHIQNNSLRFYVFKLLEKTTGSDYNYSQPKSNYKYYSPPRQTPKYTSPPRQTPKYTSPPKKQSTYSQPVPIIKTSKECYKLFENTSIEDIKKQYKKLSLKYHPDKKGGDSETFKKLVTCYEILSNVDTKNAYDMGKYNINGVENIYAKFV